MLKMKKECEKCHSSTEEQGEAYICSFECTFCAECTDKMNATCPNCYGELLLRPRRTRKPMEVAAAQVKSKPLQIGDENFFYFARCAKNSPNAPTFGAWTFLISLRCLG